MIYFSDLIGKLVYDKDGENLGVVHDFAVLTRELFPRVTSFTFHIKEKNKPPVMLSWDNVESYGLEGIKLNKPASELSFSYLRPNELLLNRDLLDRQIVDTQGLKVVRVNDLKLIDTPRQLRLVGADVGLSGLFRRMGFEKALNKIISPVGLRLKEKLIAWNYIEPLERDLSHVRLSISHKRLHELHPADVADIVEQLPPEQRAKVFRYMDIARAADTLSETEPDVTSDLLEKLDIQRASDILEIMPPDEAADILSDLSYDKAETLLGLMGVREAKAVRKLLGYHEKSAGGIMTTSFLSIKENLTADGTIEEIRASKPHIETIYYVYVVDDEDHLKGVVSLRDLITALPQKNISEIMERDIISVGTDEDQEDVANVISKYDLLAVPVVDEDSRLLGIVTVDDVIDVLEEESSEDIALLSSGSIVPLEPADTPRWFLDRTLWLSLVLFAGVAASVVIHGYINVFTSLIPVALFVPLIIRLSDDLGMHTMAFIISSTKSGEFGRRELIIKTWRDFGLASIAAISSFVVVLALSSIWKLQSGLGVIMALSLFVTVAISSLIVTLTSKILLKYEIEPSISYGPIISTLLAVISLLVYFGMASLLG